MSYRPALFRGEIIPDDIHRHVEDELLAIARAMSGIATVFSTTQNGLAPLSPGGTTTFLRADGTWTAPSASSPLHTVRVVTAAGAVTVLSTDTVVIVRKTAGAATTVNLPAAPAIGKYYYIKDGKGDANTNPLTIVPNSGLIDNAANYVMNWKDGALTVCYDGTQWSVL